MLGSNFSFSTEIPDDIFQLMRVLDIDTADGAMQFLARYFPATAQDAGK